MQFIKKLFNTQIIEIRRIIVFTENSLHMVNFQMRCLEITAYAKTPMMKCAEIPSFGTLE